MQDAFAVPALDAGRGVDVAERVAVEVVFVAIFGTGEKVIVDIVQGWLRDKNVRPGACNDTTNVTLCTAIISLSG